MIHILPIDDLREHTDGIDCLCVPEVRYEDGDGVLPEPICIHNSWDGRELVEQAEQLINNN